MVAVTVVESVLQVGVQTDAEVTAAEWGTRLLGRPEQRVTQVFCSACAVGYSTAKPELWEPLARLVLRAAYVATLVVAVETRSRHEGADGSSVVVLTLLGGGVFANPAAWIVDVIRAACEEFRDFPLDVRIVCYSPEEYARNLELDVICVDFLVGKKCVLLFCSVPRCKKS